MTGIIEAHGSKLSAATKAASRTRVRGQVRPGRRGGSHWWIHVVLGVGGFVMAFPFLWQIIMALSTNAQVTSPTPVFWPGQLQWQNFAQVFERLPFLSQLGTSIWVTLIRTAAQIVLCTLAGYAFARMRFRGRGLILGIVLSILLVPSQVYLISQYQIVQGLGWLDTLAGIVAPGLFSAFGTFLMRTAFLSMPAEARGGRAHGRCEPVPDVLADHAAPGPAVDERTRDHHGALVVERGSSGPWWCPPGPRRCRWPPGSRRSRATGP